MRKARQQGEVTVVLQRDQLEKFNKFLKAEKREKLQQTSKQNAREQKKAEAKERAERILKSYGVWTELGKLIHLCNFLELQQLCKYMYNVGIGRVQTRLTTSSVFTIFKAKNQLCVIRRLASSWKLVEKLPL